MEHLPMRFHLLFMLFVMLPEIRAQEPPQISTAAQNVPYVEREEKQFNFYPGGKIEIYAGIPGSLKIVGWKKSTVRMEAEKIVYYDTPENAKALLKKTPIRVKWNQTSALIRTPDPAQPTALMEINLTIYVPGDKTDVKAVVSQGDFSIDSVNGWVEVTDGDGSMEVRSMSGYFSGQTQRGDLYVEMSDLRWRGLEFAAGTQQGSVQLLLPEKYSAALQLETRDGEISVDYPPQVVDGEIVPPEIVTSKNAQSLKATVGDGGAPVKLATGSGKISLLRKKEE
jgi:DUF4097 and DUF4098 domain-containing protein YvlB